MDIPVFSLAMISSYLLFLDPATVPAFLGRFGGGAPAVARRPAKGRRARA